MRLGISTKLIIMTVGFLGATTLSIALSNSRQIEKRVSAREKDFNQEKAHAKASEIRGILNAAVERTMALGQLAVQNDQSKEEVDFNFNKDKNLIALTVFKVRDGRFEPLMAKVKQSFLKEHNLADGFLTTLREKLPFPLPEVTQKKIQIRNSTLPKLPPVLTIGIPLTRDEEGRVSHVALADFRMSLLQATVDEKGTRNLFITDEKGVLLAHINETKALARLQMTSNPLVETALTSDKPNLQREYEDPDTDREVIGAFIRIPDQNVIVFTEVDKTIIQEAVGTLVSSIIETAGISVSVAVFLIFLFSMTLTNPIEKLAEMIQLVSQGNFDVKARSLIRSRDEVGDLANAFDKMTEGLKERDKVKSLFSKFHGSTVAEDLLKKDIGIGGQNKVVTVFFSDIRGFTKFSEGHSPEEVVEMLNEYFEIMVKIINQHHGVVDKFIGDAIMAVWGAPESSPLDKENALRASLEMRKALAELNVRREARGQPPILIGMGLHTGPAISGTIGSNERMEYTVIGDTVNVTSRIESSTKSFGTDLLISEDLAEKVSDRFLVEKAGTVEVKGKAAPLSLFKVRGFIDSQGLGVEVRTPYSDYMASLGEKTKLAG
jgi:adenylate cyclase